MDEAGPRDAQGKRIALAGILALAGALRLGWPGLTEFKGDEARLLRLALDLAEFQAFPWCGITSSVGVPNSPVSVYLTALPLALPFLRNPIGGVLWVGALNTLAVALCYWIGRRYWGTSAGLSAALLFAAAPWAVIYSRKIWAQNYLPLFTAAYIAAALLALVEGRRRWIAAHLALLAILVQVHLSAIALAPLSALLVLLFRQRVDWRWAGIGVALGAAAFLPYVGCGLAHYGPTAGPALAAVTGRPATVSLDSLAYSWLVAVGADIHSLAGPQAFRQFLMTLPDLSPLHWLEGALALGGAAYWVAQAAQRRGERQAQAGLVCALWLLAPPLFFLRHSGPIFPHYFVTLFPAPYLAAGALLAAALRLWRGRAGRTLIGAAPAAIAAAQVVGLLALIRFVATHATPNGFGTPVGMQMATARGAAARLAETGAGEALVVGEGDNPAFHETPAVYDVLLRGLPRRFVDGSRTALLPAAGAVVLLAPGERAARAQYLAWAEEVEAFPLREGEGAILRLTLPIGMEAAPPHPAEAPALLANGALLTGYDWRGQAKPGGRVAWSLWWRVSAVWGEPEAAYQIFNHLEDAAGQRWAQQDGPSLPPGGRRAGDTLVSYFDLEIDSQAAPGPYWVRAGMYTLPEAQAVPVLDAAGNPAEAGARLGPLSGP